MNGIRLICSKCGNDNTDTEILEAGSQYKWCDPCECFTLTCQEIKA